mmetsp:Transcript_5594/g.7344  ORF Transcript_5594/g.7344 Transcript_5594/m.7344 type:complete len:369 (-) Transcript_5594:2083-3189(-)
MAKLGPSLFIVALGIFAVFTAKYSSFCVPTEFLDSLEGYPVLANLFYPFTCASCLPPPGSNVLITGASGGIGRELALRYAAGGSNLVIVARREKELLETKELCQKSAPATNPINVMAITMDLVSENAATDLFSAIRGSPDYSSLDIIILNHARIPYKLFQEYETSQSIEKDFLYTMRVNYDSCVKLIFEALPMLDKSGGRLVSIGTAGVFFGNAMQSAYLSSKAALRNFMEVLDVELKLTARHHVGTTLVHLGMVSTEQITVLNSSWTDPMTPMMLSPKRAAELITCSAIRPMSEAWVPWPMWWMSWLGELKFIRPLMSYGGFLKPRATLLGRVEKVAATSPAFNGKERYDEGEDYHILQSIKQLLFN